MEAVAWTAIVLLAGTLFGTLFYVGARIDAQSGRIDAQSTRIDELSNRTAENTAHTAANTASIRELSSRVTEHLERHAS
jgi:hypothetical protein